MTKKRTPQPAATQPERKPRPAWRQLTPDPPQRQRWLLVLSAVAVLLWTLFLAWMAWQS